MEHQYYFNPPDLLSTAFFIAILLAVLVMMIAGVYHAYQRGQRKGKRTATVFAVALLAWLAFISAVVASGAVEAEPFPRLMILFGLVNGVALAFGLSPIGKAMASKLSIASLIAFQAFRLPLELVLHSWVKQISIPQTMTWTGNNFDIASGVFALLAAFLVNARFTNKAWKDFLALWFNIAGIALLLNVMRVAVMSSPLPFSWVLYPQLLLGFHWPYVLIVPICVGGALAGHVILTRAILLHKT